MNKQDRKKSYTVSLSPQECDRLKLLGEGSLTRAVRMLSVAYWSDVKQVGDEVSCGQKERRKEAGATSVI